VVAASAGNHAQGVALAARTLGTRATIVMPRTTPQIKVDAVRALGGAVTLHGDQYDDACARALVLARRRGLVFVHAYDDPDVIAGQGTIGQEILRQHPGSLDAIFAPVGGGGLIAGIAAFVKEVRPEVRIVGVEPEEDDAMDRSLRAGRRVRLGHVGLFADGVAVSTVGAEPFRLSRSYVDEMVLVTNDEICAAIKEIFEDRRAVLEPAGALAYAGLKAWAARKGSRGRRLVAVASGANVNFDRLRHVAERAAVGERREAVLAVTLPERPGALRAFCGVLGERAITEFNYRLATGERAHIFVGVQVAGGAEIRVLIAGLRAHGYEVLDLTDNELAKLHIRHMVGGRPPEALDEKLYRFEFPERPGALRHFLDRMGDGWNISLFHYRSHGADFGRVLMGLQVPPADARRFARFLRTLGYWSVEETGNPAYRLFLA
jgi:threonine dehydratase